MLRVDGLRFAYGQRTVLSGIDLEVRPGEFFGILGPNGSGKSTLLKLAARLLVPTEGRVLLDGRDLRTLRQREVARQVAFLPQDTRVEFPYRVSEVVLLGRTPHLGLFGFAGERDVAAAREALVLTGSGDLADRRIDELSGGERQRVLLAKALAQAPRLLLLDEPTSHLDLRHQVGIHDLLRRRNRAGDFTVITVLHDLNLAAQYCDRVLLLDEGRVFACGSVEEVLTYGNVRKVFAVDPYVGVNELNGTRFLIPMRGETTPAGEDEVGPGDDAPR